MELAPEAVPEAKPAELVQGPVEQGPTALPALFGDYELLEKLGEGGMGVVYKARQRSLDRLVALKMLPLTGPHARPEFIKRFRAEAVVAASLQHPNIVAIHEVGVHQGQHFFAMDYVEGMSLAELVGNRPLPPKQAARYLQAIAEAVHYAHERGILHRDLKPSNILLDAQDQPRVADFGLAKRLDSDSELTLTGQVLGSPHYIPPEQAVGKHNGLSRRSDVYGLGAVLYHLLTGRPPFIGAEMAETLHQVLNVDPVAPRLLNPMVPRDLETICLKCLEKEPSRRYPTAQAVAEELARFLQGEPIAARPVGLLGRVARWCRRKPTLAAVISALVLSLILGLGGVLWALRQTRLHAAAERQQRARAEERLTQLELKQADALFGDLRHTPAALAWLARVLRNDPSNPAAPQRLIFALTYRSFPLALAEFTNTSCGDWHPDSTRVGIGTTEGEARICSLAGSQGLAPPLRHAARIHHLHFAPDGNRLVTASEDGTARVWDAQSGQPLTPSIKHPNAVVWAEFSPDGKRIATVSLQDAQIAQRHTEAGHRDGLARARELLGGGQPSAALATADAPTTAAEDRRTPRPGGLSEGAWVSAARVWDAATGQPLTPWMEHPLPIFTAQFSPDGRLLLTASWGHSIRLWRTETGQSLTTLPEFRGGVRAADFSPDSRWVLASDDNLVRIWDLATGQPLGDPLAYDDLVMAAQFNPTGNRVLTSCLDGFLRVSNARSGRQHMQWRFGEGLEGVQQLRDSGTGRLRAPIGRENQWGRCAEWSPEAQRVAAAGEDCLVKVWGLPGPKGLGEWIAHDRTVIATTFSPDGLRLLTRSAEGVARVWDVLPGRGLPVVLPTADALERAQFSPDGRRVVTADASGSVCVWDSFTGRRRPLELRHGDGVRWIEFHPTGERLATASRDRTARVWNVTTGEPLTEPLQHGGCVNCARFSSDGQRLVTASDDGAARIWDARSGQAVTPPLRHSLGVNGAAFSPDGQRVATASWDGAARVWEARAGKLVFSPLQHEGGVLSAEFTRDGRRVVTASADGTVRFWDAHTGAPLQPVLRHGGWVLVVRLNPQETLAATASTDQTARVWDLATGRVLFTTDRHNQAVQDVQFSPDGDWLASTSGEGHARLWDWRTGMHVSEGLGPAGHSLQFSPDGQRLLVGARDGARIWNVRHYPAPAPAWLPRLAEAVGGRRLKAARELEPVPAQELLAVRRIIEQSPAADPYTLWAKWFFADRSNRPQSPDGILAMTDHVQSLLVRNTTASLFQALHYSPTNREAFARLAELSRAHHTPDDAVSAAAIEWWDRKAKGPAPR
jgi:WD40 repeat protein/predicted Ser/Thr protein kinase